MATEMLRTVDGLNDRLMINAPPRAGKSQLVSRFFPAWYLGNHPDAQVLPLAYSDTFAEGWGRRTRAVFEEWGEAVFGVRLEASRFFARQSAAEWTFAEHGGGMVSVGIGGAAAAATGSKTTSPSLTASDALLDSGGSPSLLGPGEIRWKDIKLWQNPHDGTWR
jgi:hypothetical protein